MPVSRTRFGQAVVEALRAAGLSQREFARRVGADQGSLQAVISGRRRPTLAALEPWADALELAGPSRTAFLEAGWLALSPPAVTALVDELRAAVARARRPRRGARGRT